MDLSLFEMGLLIGGGFLAGIINTLAGYGSIITLALLMDVVGLPATLANGTNRVNVMAMGIVGSLTFIKHGRVDFTKSRIYIILTFIGAMFGVYVATQISNEAFKGIFKYLIIILFLMVLVNPKRWLREKTEEGMPPLYFVIPTFLLVGFYGGFIQMGVGLFLIALLVLGSKYNLIDANATKLIIVASYTSVVLFIFWYNGLVNWEAGIFLAIGQATGGWLTAQYSSKYKNANLWAYRLLILIIAIVVLNQFNFFTWISELF